MVVNIIDRNFSFLGQIDNYESLILTKKWHNIGSFELHLHEDTQYADKLQKENIIFTSENKAFVIMHREVSTADGSLVVKGLEIKSFLARWLVFPPTGQAYYRVNSNTETIIKTYVLATLTRKGINNIIVAPNQNRGMQTVYQSRYKNLADELEKLSLASGLGWDIYLDLENKQFIFDVFEGQDRTAGQNTLPPAIFSIEYDNVAEQTLIDSRMNYANVAVVAGQGEGADRAITIVGDAEGLDSFELFVDARDIEDDTDLPERGQQKLAEMQEVFSFDSQVLTDKNLVYEEDFKLGDLVTIQNTKWNITADRRITEVTEIYEENGFRLDIAFGESMPTIKDIIKQVTDVPVAEGGSEGERGPRGFSLEYDWQGTQLGIKREDESDYQYIDLRGPKGDKGDPGSDANVTYENVTNALGYTPVNKAGDTMTGDLKVDGNIVAGTEYIVGYNGTSESLRRFKFKYNGSTGHLELWRYSNNTGWTLCATFPDRNQGSGGLTIEGKQVAYKSDIPTKLSEFTKDIDFDERYYTETEIDNFLDNHVNNTSNPHSVTKSQVGLGNVQNYGIATQAEAEAGSINNKYMTPLRTRQAIENVLGTIEKGTKIVTSITEPTGIIAGDQWHREI